MESGRGGTWRTVRVFISSTFRDMQSERDWLVRFVFPRLREELLRHRIHLVDADLRWGVTGERDALEVCREIIDECRPRFLCMLGGRYGWVPPGKTRSITADEVHYGVLDRALGDRGLAYFYFRDDAATDSMAEATAGEFREPQGSESQIALVQLKQSVVAAGLHPFIYPAKWDNESRRLTDLKEFGNRVYQDLLGSISSDSELRDRFLTDPTTQLDEFAEESAAMEAFVEERSERFVLGSRAAVMDELLAHARLSGGNGYLCLTGAPGSGKSALLAHLSRQPALNDQRSLLLVCHFVGASPGSTDVHRTLRRLCLELKAGCPGLTGDIPDDPEKLSSAFPHLLRQACKKKRVVILLDAVNQFGSSPRSSVLHWLPEELPANARFILSALEGPALDELRRRPHPPREIELRPLTPDDSGAIIEQFLTRYRKEFEPAQRAALLSKTDAGTPLYLLAALEELRTLGTYEEITRRVVELPSTTRDLFIWILGRLEDDEGFRDASGRRVGRELVSRFAALLGASRHGLSQRELADLIDPRDPRGNVASLLNLLHPYLMRRGELLDFYHGEFRSAVKETWLKTDAQIHAANAPLATYFRSAADPQGDSSWLGEMPRAVSELPFHLAMAGMSSQLVEVLSDLAFIERKCTFGLMYETLDDYATAGRLVSSPPELADPLGQFARFARAQAHLLASRPELTFQQAANEPDRTAPAQAAERRWKNRAESRPWLRWVNKPSERLDSVTMDKHDGRVLCCAQSPDGLTIASGATDRAVRIWDSLSGQFLARLTHDSAVQAVQFSRSGSRLATGSGRDGWWGEVWIWDMATRRPVGRKVLGVEPLALLMATADGHFLACCGGGKRPLYVLSADSGRVVREYRHSADRVTQVRHSCSDRDLVALIHDKAGLVELLDAATLEIVDTLDLGALTRSIRFVCEIHDGGRVYGLLGDDRATLFDPSRNAAAMKIPLSLGQVQDCAVSADGRSLAIAVSDRGMNGGVHVLDATGTITRTTPFFETAPAACIWSQDSRRLVVGLGNGTLRSWDAGSPSADRPRADTTGVGSPLQSGQYLGAVSPDDENLVEVWTDASSSSVVGLSGRPAGRQVSLVLTSSGEERGVVTSERLGMQRKEGIEQALFSRDETRLLLTSEKSAAVVDLPRLTKAWVWRSPPRRSVGIRAKVVFVGFLVVFVAIALALLLVSVALLIPAHVIRLAMRRFWPKQLFRVEEWITLATDRVFEANSTQIWWKRIQRGVFEPLTPAVHACFRPAGGGSEVVCASGRQLVRLDATTGEPSDLPIALNCSVSALDASPGEDVLACCSDFRQDCVRLVDPVAGDVVAIASIPKRDGVVFLVPWCRFSPDGRQLAVAVNCEVESAIYVWSADLKAEVLVLPAYGRVAWGPDSRSLAVWSSQHNRLAIHSVPSGRVLAELEMEGSPVTLEWSERTGTIWAASGDGRYRQLRLEEQESVGRPA